MDIFIAIMVRLRPIERRGRLVSDDNGSARQRTLPMKFVVEDQGQASSPAQVSGRFIGRAASQLPHGACRGGAPCRVPSP